MRKAHKVHKECKVPPVLELKALKVRRVLLVRKVRPGGVPG